MSEANHNQSKEIPIASTASEQNLVIESQPMAETNPEKELNLHKFAHKLREHNRKLLKKVFHLEQEILESNQSLEEQKAISQNHYLCVAKQAEKINQYQEEITEIVQQLATYQQKNHHQQVKVEKLIQQLEVSQQKTSKLEEDYAKLQTLNNTKNSELLKEKEQQIQVLKERLHKQQQYILEQKTSNYEKNEKASSQPIKAWSVKSVEAHSVPTTAFSADNLAPTPDWPAPAIAKNQTTIKSLAAVKLPQFPRRTEENSVTGN
jgi:chromosome segregation ATPase